MKKLVLFLAISALFAACEGKDKGNGKLDPDAMISLRAAKSVNKTSRADNGHLSPLEIVTQTEQIIFTNKEKYPNSKELSRGFAPAQRDFVNERLLMWGTDIISQDGTWNDSFIGGADVVLVRFVPADETNPHEHRDTVAYIKNATLQAAKIATKAAYDRGDYATVYKLFDNAFTFEPITGAEWQALKAKGEN